MPEHPCKNPVEWAQDHPLNRVIGKNGKEEHTKGWTDLRNGALALFPASILLDSIVQQMGSSSYVVCRRFLSGVYEPSD